MNKEQFLDQLIDLCITAGYTTNDLMTRMMKREKGYEHTEKLVKETKDFREYRMTELNIHQLKELKAIHESKLDDSIDVDAYNHNVLNTNEYHIITKVENCNIKEMYSFYNYSETLQLAISKETLEVKDDKLVIVDKNELGAVPYDLLEKIGINKNETAMYLVHSLFSELKKVNSIERIEDKITLLDIIGRLGFDDLSCFNRFIDNKYVVSHLFNIYDSMPNYGYITEEDDCIDLDSYYETGMRIIYAEIFEDFNFMLTHSLEFLVNQYGYAFIPDKELTMEFGYETLDTRDNRKIIIEIINKEIEKRKKNSEE